MGGSPLAAGYPISTVMLRAPRCELLRRYPGSRGAAVRPDAKIPREREESRCSLPRRAFCRQFRFSFFLFCPLLPIPPSIASFPPLPWGLSVLFVWWCGYREAPRVYGFGWWCGVNHFVFGCPQSFSYPPPLAPTLLPFRRIVPFLYGKMRELLRVGATRTALRRSSRKPSPLGGGVPRPRNSNAPPS